MGVADIVILLLVAAAFVAVVIRVKRKGVCADCAESGSCGGHCGHCSSGADGASCPAALAPDDLDEKLGRGL